MSEKSKKNKYRMYLTLTCIFAFGFVACIVLTVVYYSNQNRINSIYSELASKGHIGIDADPYEEQEVPAVDTPASPIDGAVSQPSDKKDTDDGSHTGTVEPATDTSSVTVVPSPVVPKTLFEQLGVVDPGISPDWKALQDINSDVHAWIYIPGTQVDYPVLQAVDDNSFYLNHNIDKSYGYPSCIFTEDYNARDFSDGNTILYGHNMLMGPMFGTLHYYEDREFFDKYQFIYVYLPGQEKPLVYRIFAAVTYSNDHILTKYDFNNMVSYAKFLDELKNLRGMTNNFRPELEIAPEDKLITLSTCVSSSNKKRYIVVGVQIHDEILDGDAR